MTELKLTCVAAFFSDMYASANVAGNYHYRYNVLDSVLAQQGIFTPHTSELYAIWGSNNTDGGDPKCFNTPAASGGCMEAGAIVQSYWISFVRTLDPNVFRKEGAAVWEQWSVESPRRVVFDNGGASMEVMGRGEGEVVLAGMDQRTRCNELVLPLSKAANAGLREGESLLPFANGTRMDPTTGIGRGNATVLSSGGGNGDGSETATNCTGTGYSTSTAPKATFTGAAGRFEAGKELAGVFILIGAMFVLTM